MSARHPGCRRDRRRDGGPRARRRLPHRPHALRPRPAGGPAGRGRRRRRGVRRGHRTALRYARAGRRWQAVAAADDIDVVSVVVANPLHREVVEGLLAAGKHVLCEKPLAPTVADAEAMVAAAAAGPSCGPGSGSRSAAPRDRRRQALVDDGSLGRPVHFNGHYWCDYAAEPDGADELALQGRPGFGRARGHRQPPRRPRRVPLRPDRVRARADARHDHRRARPAAGRRRRPRGRRLERRPRAGRERGPRDLHRDVRLRRRRHAVGLEGRVRASQLPRLRAVRHGCRRPSTSSRPGEFSYVDRAVRGAPPATGPFPSVPRTRTSPAACPWTSRGSGYGQNDLFAFQARAFLGQVAGIDEPPAGARRSSTGCATCGCCAAVTAESAGRGSVARAEINRSADA